MTGRRLLLLFSAVSLLSIWGCAGSQPRSYSNAGTSAEGAGFYDALSQYGTWENVPAYGDCWVPLDVPAGWRPYTVGYWEATDYGWMWVSQDPWGGIPYHYGRWAEDDTYGWIWVPDDDYVWAPAWVAWRYGNGYVGWAPLPPDVGWQSGIGLSVSVSDLDQRTSRDSWCFSMVRDFGATRISASVLPPSRNVTLISRTTNVTRYEVVNSRPAERGLSVEILERDTGRRFPLFRPPVTELRTRPARPTPQEQQGPSRAMIQRLDAEQRQFGQRMQQERAALGREHERELKQQGKAGTPIDQLRQLHQAEMQAQQDREGREQRALDQRRRIIQKMQSSQGPGKDKGQGKGHDKGQARGQDKGKSEGQGKGQSDNPDEGKDRGKGRDQGTSGN